MVESYVGPEARKPLCKASKWGQWQPDSRWSFTVLVLVTCFIAENRAAFAFRCLLFLFHMMGTERRLSVGRHVEFGKIEIFEGPVISPSSSPATFPEGDGFALKEVLRQKKVCSRGLQLLSGSVAPEQPQPSPLPKLDLADPGRPKYVSMPVLILHVPSRAPEEIGVCWLKGSKLQPVGCSSRRTPQSQ